jgi:hypothetical protein
MCSWMLGRHVNEHVATGYLLTVLIPLVLNGPRPTRSPDGSAPPLRR